MIKLDKISKSFGEKKVINNLSFHFEKGKKYGIMAPSGSGKTTLFRIISSLDTPDNGSVETNSPSTISYLFQEDRLFESFTAAENILAVGNKNFDTVIKKLRLDEFLHKFPREISGGMKRRTALARALVRDADIYLFDEPFTGLDESLKEEIISYLKDALGGKTLILSSHDRYESEKLCDIILNFDQNFNLM